MALTYTAVDYSTLNPAQQENYNYHKISARLADYGFTTIRLYDDFEGADFIAKHVNGQELLRVQLKGRLTFAKKYKRGDGQEPIYIAFRHEGETYLYPHDELLDRIFEHDTISIIEGTEAWKGENGTYHVGSLSADLQGLLEEYRVPRARKSSGESQAVSCS